MDLGISEKVAPLLERVRSFINEQVMRVEHEFVAEIEVDNPFVLTDRQTEILKSLKTQALGLKCQVVHFVWETRPGC